jgi:hypothetical protein
VFGKGRPRSGFSNYWRKKEMKATAILFVIASVICGNTMAADLRFLGSVQFKNQQQASCVRDREYNGCIKAAKDLSAIGRLGAKLVIGGDEGTGPDRDVNIIQILSKQTDDQYVVIDDIILFSGDREDGKEMDIEGIAVEGKYIYVVGSHSSKRKGVKSSKSYKKNRKTFHDKKIDDEINRDWLYRLKVNAQMQVTEKKKITLRNIIQKHEVLKTFSRIPSKENGIDIEGIAVVNDWIYAGFRGPVLRKNYVPVLKLKFDDPENTARLLWVNFGGGGIRDMATVEDGFLVISGPVGDGPGAYSVHHWDGRDMIPGDGREQAEIGKMIKLGEIDSPHGSKAEGILVMDANDSSSYQFMVIFDGIKNGSPKRFKFSKDN